MRPDPDARVEDPEEIASTIAARDVRAGTQLPRRRRVSADPEDVVETPLDKLATGVPPKDRRGRAARRDRKRTEDEAMPAATRADAHYTLPEQLTRTSRAAARGQEGPRRPAVWADVETLHSPVPVYGAFPKRFVPWAIRLLGCASRPTEVLHVCSGALTREDVMGGTRVDLRPEAAPDVVADGRALPFDDASWRAVMIDPPYSPEYARDLYGTEYPRPSHLLREAARVCRPGGRIAILHFLVPSPPKGCALVGVRGVTQGCGYRIRALTIYERVEQGELALDERETV